MTALAMIGTMQMLKTMGWIKDFRVQFNPMTGGVTSIVTVPLDVGEDEAKRAAYARDLNRTMCLMISEPMGRA